MKKLLIFSFALCITSIVFAQRVKLKLSSNLDTLKFHQTTLKEAEKIFGHPDNTNRKVKRSTKITYNKFGMELHFHKNIGNKLWCIEFKDNSPIVINDSIKLQSTDTLKLVRLLGQPNEKGRGSSFIKFEYYADTPSSADFYFNNQGILTSIILQEHIVIGVDF
jgi:hypothetical protein